MPRTAMGTGSAEDSSDSCSECTHECTSEPQPKAQRPKAKKAQGLSQKSIAKLVGKMLKAELPELLQATLSQMQDRTPIPTTSPDDAMTSQNQDQEKEATEAHEQATEAPMPATQEKETQTGNMRTPSEEILLLHGLILENITDDEIKCSALESLKALQNFVVSSRVATTPAGAPTRRELSTPQRIQRTYASAVRETKATLLISPQEGANGAELQAQLASIDGASAFSIKEIKRTRQGSLVVQCRDEEKAAALQAKINNQTNLKASATTPKVRQTRLIIHHVPSAVGEHGVRQALHSTFGLGPEIGPITAIKVGAQTNHWRFQVPSRISGALLASNSVVIGFKKCPIRKYLEITRCFRCQEFGHIAPSCTGLERCSRCDGTDHVRQNCQSQQLRCRNCMRANALYPQYDLDVRHEATDSNCPVWRNAIKLAKEKEAEARQRRQAQPNQRPRRQAPPPPRQAPQQQKQPAQARTLEGSSSHARRRSVRRRPRREDSRGPDMPRSDSTGPTTHLLSQ